MDVKKVRITEELRWAALKYRFYTLEKLQEAIADGTLDAMIKNCADTLHGGDTRVVINAMRKNLSSQQTNMKKATYVPAENKDDWKRYELLWEYTGKLAESIRPVVSGLPESTKAKARWMLTKEEMNAIDKYDFKTLDSIYQNMMSKKAKKPEDIVKVMTMEDFLDRLKHISALRSYAKAAMAKNNAKAQLSESLLNKLNKGGKTTLSAEEVEELLKLIK